MARLSHDAVRSLASKTGGSAPVVSLYLDANVFVALLTPDPLTARADTFLEARREVFIVSDFGAAEYVSAISRRVRTAEIAGSRRLAARVFRNTMAASLYYTGDSA